MPSVCADGGPAHGKPPPTYFILGRPLVLQSVCTDKARRLESPVRRPQLCYQYAQAGPSGWKAPTTYLRRTLEAPTYLLVDALSSAISMRRRGSAAGQPQRNIPTSDALSSAISMCRRGPAAVKHQPTTYVRGNQLCHQYSQTGPGGPNAPIYRS